MTVDRTNARSPFRPRLIVAGLALALAAQPAATGGLENFYNSISAYHNATAPQAIKAQTMHVFTGGSLFMRTPNRSYQLASFSPPSLRSGCGGIDLFGGSFSFINADEFVQLLRNIGQNAAGMLFMTALQAMAPDNAEIMKYLQNAVQFVNRMNVNSCEAAQIALEKTGASAFLRDNIRKVINWSSSTPGQDDYEKAKRTLSGDDRRAQQAQNAIVASNPEANSSLVLGNLVWRALKRSGAASLLTDSELMVIMSAIGTVVFSRPDGANENANPVLSHKPRTITFDKLIGRGNQDNTRGDLPKVLVCGDGTAEHQCTRMNEQVYNGRPFAELAAEKMHAIFDKIRDRDPLTEGEINFVNATSIPVYRLLSVAASFPTDSVAVYTIMSSADVIGAELAAAFVLRVLDEAEKAIQNRSYASSEPERHAMSEFMATITALRQEIHQQRIAYTNRINSIEAMMQQVAFLEKMYMNNLSERIATSLRFSRRMRGQS